MNTYKVVTYRAVDRPDLNITLLFEVNSSGRFYVDANQIYG